MTVASLSAPTAKLEHGSIKAYVNEVEAEAGTRLTQAHGEPLIRLARSL